MRLPEGFETAIKDALEIARGIEGYLTEREMRFLFLLGSYPTAHGEILEIGSFKGKSTIILAKAVQSIGGCKIIAVDPLTSPSSTDPVLKGQKSAIYDFSVNLKRAGVENTVEFHEKYSHEVATNWDRKLRLLWIDGDHTYSGTKYDFDMFSRFLSNGAIVALHDVLLLFDGPIKVFMEDVLLSNKFGPAGLCGSIGWAQHLEDKETCLKYKNEKLKLYSKLRRLIPFRASGKPLQGVRKFKYKILRSQVPHSEINYKRWIGKVLDLQQHGKSVV